ncbi:hypothetical protein EFM18_03115 [Limosilactobacillus fermentum]|nr:hypothetical protein [Limosilactobacillus fermentum]
MAVFFTVLLVVLLELELLEELLELLEELLELLEELDESSSLPIEPNPIKRAITIITHTHQRLYQGFTCTYVFPSLSVIFLVIVKSLLSYQNQNTVNCINYSRNNPIFSTHEQDD